MAKKKGGRKKSRRYGKSRRRRIAEKRRGGVNNHHLLWQRTKWGKQRWAYALRTHTFCVMPMDVRQHSVVHHEVLLVPVPPDEKCREVYLTVCNLWKDGLISDQTPVNQRLCLLIALFAGEEGAVQALTAQLAVIHGFEKAPSK